MPITPLNNPVVDNVDANLAAGAAATDPHPDAHKDQVAYNEAVETAVNATITVAEANEAALAGKNPDNLALRIVETSTGVWSGDAPARTGGANPIVFIGATDPTDATNGITTPANIADYDEWIDTTP